MKILVTILFSVTSVFGAAIGGSPYSPVAGGGGSGSTNVNIGAGNGIIVGVNVPGQSYSIGVSPNLVKWNGLDTNVLSNLSGGGLTNGTSATNLLANSITTNQLNAYVNGQLAIAGNGTVANLTGPQGQIFGWDPVLEWYSINDFYIDGGLTVTEDIQANVISVDVIAGGIISGNGIGLTNLMASSVFSGGQLPPGTLAISNTYSIGGTYTMDATGTNRIVTNYLSQVSIGGNAATATTASGLSGVLTIGNLPPFVLTNFWAGTFTNLGNYVGVGTFTNTGNAGFGGSVTMGGFVVTANTITPASSCTIGSVASAIPYLIISANAEIKLITASGTAVSLFANDFSPKNNLGAGLGESGLIWKWLNVSNIYSSGYGTFTNGFGVLATNVAPTGPVTIGVTAPDFWSSYTNTAGQKVFTPGWLNH